jgi:hypothetical protein
MTATEGKAASASITERIRELGDWRGATLARVRELIHEADPAVEEEWKWRGTPVWAHDGGICTGESYKAVVKLTFHRGAALADPKKLFNSSLEGNVRRAIDIREGEKIDGPALKSLIRAAIAANTAARTKRPAAKARPTAAKPAKAKPANAKPANAKPAKAKTTAKAKRPAAQLRTLRAPPDRDAR